MSTAALEQAISSTRAVLAGVKPDQLDDLTPCASWKVRDLVNHVVGGQYFFAAMAEGVPQTTGGENFADGDLVAAFDKSSAACVAAFQADGVMTKMLTLPFAQMPGAAFVGIAATDTFTHGWDLAKATSQPTDLAPELAAQLLTGAKQAIPDSFRGPEPAPFGPEQSAPAGASNADQLAAFLGRTV
jgi:uncharacterized protein (TIGR03086 family)